MTGQRLASARSCVCKPFVGAFIAFAPPVCRHSPPSKSFVKKVFHLSGRMSTDCHIMDYGMKDVSGIFQNSFMAESDKKFSAKRFFNLSQTIFHSAEIDFPFSAE